MELPPFLRLLLTTDGTVTKSLEAFFWEPVNIAAVEQCVSTLANAGAQPNEPRLLRKVKLVGLYSQRLYARAESIVAINQLPKQLAEELLAGQIGIGELVRASGLSSFRKIMDLGAQMREQELEIWRRYAIFFNGLPAIEITEWFPLSVYP